MTHQLNDARVFVASIVIQSPAIVDVIVLAATATHITEEFTHMPRVAFLSQEMRTGKTRALKTAGLLSANPVTFTRATTDPAILSAFNTPQRPTPLVEELSHIFGRDGRAQRKPNLAMVILDGCENGAVSQFSRSGSVESVPTFALMFAAGRGAGFPDDARDRAIICTMRRSETEGLSPLNSDVASDGEYHRNRMAGWAISNRATICHLAREVSSEIHPDLKSRARDMWAPLFAVAYAAGGDWPARCLSAFRELACGNSDVAQLSKEDRVRLAAAAFLKSTTGLPVKANGDAILRSSVLLAHLRTTDFGIFRTYTDRALQHLITEALGESRSFRPDGREGASMKGWDAAEILALGAAVEAEINRPREVATVELEDF